MAHCGSRCPYHWHDDDCEYCSARGDEIIDLEHYSYDTCPYYQEYYRMRYGEDAAKKGSEQGHSSGGLGGFLFLVIIVIAAVSMFRGTRSDVPHNPAPTAISTEAASDALEPEPLYQDSGFVFPSSDTALIPQAEVEALSDGDLTYAINEIYARHGYIFRSDELRGYYEQFSWYTGEIPAGEFSVDCFNQIEQQNWNLLVKERDRRRASN